MKQTPLQTTRYPNHTVHVPRGPQQPRNLVQDRRNLERSLDMYILLLIKWLTVSIQVIVS